MGLTKSKEKSNIDQKVECLEKRVSQLEFKLATYREIEIKVDECYDKIGLDKQHKHQQYIIKTEMALSDANKQIVELEKQIKLLNELHKKNNIKDQYDLNSLCNVNHNNDNTNNSKNREITLNELSKKQIEILVNKLLADENINIKYLPDWVERQLYINVINLIINLLEQLLSGASVNMMGHTLGFTLTPQRLPCEPIIETISNEN